MSKRKPALRIGGGILNRGNLTYNQKVSVNPSNDVVKIEQHDEIDSQLANFMKEIDEVSASNDTQNEHVQPLQHERVGNWQICVDEKTQHPYYWNTVTDEVTWVLPEEVAQILNSASDNAQQQTTEKHQTQDKLKDHTGDTPEEVNSIQDEVIRGDLDEHKITEPPKNVHTAAIVESADHADSTELLHSVVDHPTELIQSTENEELDNVKNVSTQCKLCSSTCEASNDVASTKMEVLKLRDTLCGKLNFLGVSTASLLQSQILLIQIQTRIADWKAKVLPTSYVLKQLEEAHLQIRVFEDSATPPGWTCQWDSATSRYFYVNAETQSKQWTYPDMLGGNVATASADSSSNDEDAMPAKKAKTDDPPLPPLPDIPLEKPPPPPQSDEDDGYDVEEDIDGRKMPDDGVMMEISDGENDSGEERNAHQTASVPVLSQQPIIYKGPEVLSYAPEQTLKNEALIRLQQSYSSAPVVDSSNKFKSKKSKVKKSGAAKKPYKAMSSLVAQWQRAKSEIDQEDRMLAESDEEEKPEPTAFKIAKWKQDQILSGKAVSNPNFEPVPTDWRTRLLEKKKKKM